MVCALPSSARLCAALVLALVPAAPVPGAEPPGAARLTGAVARIVDGDTLRLHGLPVAVRLWGLDAPERGQKGAERATAALGALAQGQSLSCRIRDIDRYGRIVGQCHLPDGRDLAATLIAAGDAREYCRYSGGHYGTCAIPPDRPPPN